MGTPKSTSSGELDSLECGDSESFDSHVLIARCAEKGQEDQELEYKVVEKENEACTDSARRCDSWAKSGECSNNPDFMHETCKKACAICQAKEDEDEEEDTYLWKVAL